MAMERRQSAFTAALDGIAEAPPTVPTDTTVTTFLQELLGGKEYREAEAVKLTIRNPNALKALFTTIVGALEESAQIQALDALINLVRSSCSNVEACSSYGLQRAVLTFLSERAFFADPFVSNAVLKKILRLFLYLSNHSVTSDDVRAMLSVFRSPRMKEEVPDDQAVSYYVSTLEMIARDSFGPVSFFDLSGEYSGLVLPVLDAFPSNGYTFCAWIKFECLPDTAAPLFTFCGKSDVGIMCSFIRSSLAVTCFDKKKNDSHVEIPDLITPGRWHFLCIVHTHRPIRGSKLDIYMNSELRHSTKLTYPNTALMAPVVKSYIAMRERDRGPSLRVLLGPTALFGQPLPSNIIGNVKSADEYDALVFQFNSYISSSTTAGPGAAVPTGSTGAPSTGAGEGLLFAYDARNCDRQRGLCFDSSGNGNHAEAASTGVRLRRTGTFKQSVAQLGGPLICLPLLVAASNATTVHSNVPVDSNGLALASPSGGSLISQFDEDSEFLQQMADMIARPLGVRTVSKVLLLIAEIMRHSLVNKFIFRRHQGVRLTALLIRSLPPRYLTADLLLSIERFRSAVISDRTLSDEIYKFLLFNFRIWINAPTDLQHTVFTKLEIATRRDAATSSAVSTRHFLRCLSWIYWKFPNPTALRRAREFSVEDIDALRRRVLSIIKLELCEAQPVKTSVIGRGAKAKEMKTQLSYESTKSLIFCMIGKPTNPMSSGLNADGTPSLQDAGEVGTTAKDIKSLSDGEADAGSVVENVPENDLPDLIELLIELSVQPTAPAGLLDLFGRLGGLRIWLPLLNFPSNVLRVMTLRLLRTYLTLKCQCVQDREKVTSTEKTQLSVGDSYLILNALNAAGHPVTLGVYTEVLLIVLGIQVTEEEMDAPVGSREDYDALVSEEMLAGAMIWHTYMMFPFLEMVRASSASIRLVAIRHLKILFASSTPASAINRNMLIYNSISSSGALTVSSTTEQTPIIEAILSLRGNSKKEERRELPHTLFGVELNGCPGVPMSRLRELVTSSEESEETRINALYSIISLDDVEFVSSLFAVHSEGERKKNSHGRVYKNMSKRLRVAAVEIMAHLQPEGCASFITQTAYELISSIISLEAKSNDVSWILLQDPFTSLSRFIDSPKELEMVVVSLLKATLDKMNELLSVEINLRGKDDIPSRDSVLWRNAENLATLSAAVVLHYDPDTLGGINPVTLDATEVQANLVYWKCDRLLWHEAELVDAILGVWQHLASYFHSEKDASFGRKPARSAGLSQRSIDNSGSQSPPANAALNGVAGKANSSRGLGFGFNLLAVQSGQAQGSVAMRPHPGGPMRQVLQLLLRSFYLILLSDDQPGDVFAKRARTMSGTMLEASAMFFARINKLEYFLNVMGLGRDMTQFESSFTPSRTSTANIGIGGLVTLSSHIKAAPGDETSLILWFVPELAVLISRVRRKLWPDSAVKLAGVLASLVSQPLRSSEELISLLAQSDFSSNNQEVCRRDGFYFEQMAHARESRATRRAAMLADEVEEKTRAKAELDRISRSTRNRQPSVAGESSASSDESGSQVWLQRVKAKDIDDWMRLRVLLKWGVRHVWTSSSSSDLTEDTSNSLSEALKNNEFWRLDNYTSSNWIRCRLLPDTDDTMADYAEYVKSMAVDSAEVAAAVSLEAISCQAADIIKPEDDRDIGESGAGVDDAEYEDEEENYDVEEVSGTVMEGMDGFGNEDSGSGGETSEGSRTPGGGATEEDQKTSPLSGSPTEPNGNLISSGEPLSSSQASPQGEKPAARPDNLVDTPDVTNSVKGSKDKFPRIGTISSRFSSGIRLITGTGARPSEKGEEGDVANADLSEVEKKEPSANESERQARRSRLESGSTETTSETTTDPNAASPASVAPASNTPSRILRGLSSRNEQWRTLSACYRTKAYLILPSGLMIYGILRIGTTTIVFEGEYVTTLKKLSDLADDSKVEVNLGDSFISELKRRVWGVRVIRVIHRRRFLLNPQNGIELYFVDGSSCFFGLEGRKEADLVYATLKERKPPCLAKWGKRLLSAERMFGKSKWTEMWMRREISNFEYLMLLNVSAGRSYNDLTQYPIFPWVIRDYESTQLRLDDPTVYRDLSKPIGVQSEVGQKRASNVFASSKADAKLPPYHFDTAYSHVRSVFYFLSRLAPITGAFAVDGLSVENFLAGGVFDSFSSAYAKATEEENHNYELTPEFFYLADFLVGDRNKQLVKGTEEGSSVAGLAGLRSPVQLPPWASSVHDFVRQHRLALESDYVSENLHHWIDLIFGHKQHGQPAIDAQNSYHIACHPERLDLRSLNVGSRARLTLRGSVPLQLFRKPHPARLSQDESLETRYPASNAVAALSSRRQVRRHDLASKHTAPVLSVRFASALNSTMGMGGPGLGSGTGLGAHASGSNDHGIVVYTTDSDGVVLAKRYLNSVPDQPKLCPFSLVDVDQWWKLPTGSLVRDGVVFYEQMISCGYWDGSWRIHWSADGELLQRIAFHKKPILCMAHSEDDFTGDLALAFGSEDCTVSVWALSKVAATRSRRMFVKKDLPIGGLPWVLLHGHTSPVVAVALKVDLDIVVSSAKDNTILVHSLRAAMPLHNIEISCAANSFVTHMTISNHGETLIHSITNRSPPKGRSHSFNVLNPVNHGSSNGEEQSDLYLVSVNGQLISHDRLEDAEGKARVLLEQAAFFTRSGEYIITATGGSESVIEVRDAGAPAAIVRRIDCKRSSILTCVSLSQDERCIMCGYADGSVVAYALHYGIADGCKNQLGLDKKARDEEAEALARANKRDQLKKEADEKKNLFKWGSAGATPSKGLWIRPGKIVMPPEPYLSVMQSYYSWLKQPCVGDDPTYEALVKELWCAMYDRDSLASESKVEEVNLLDLPDDLAQPAEGKEFERSGPTWSRLGFQRPDPTTDFRAGGIFSLKCLVYFAKTYYEQASRMVEHQIPGSRQNTYPWGLAGINITCMLSRVFWAGDGCLYKERHHNWPFFAEEDAFYQIFSEVFILFDHLWAEMDAHYGMFSEVIQATMRVVLDAMEEAKADLQAFLVEIRAQSLSNTSRFHKGRAASRSMEEFLVNMSSSLTPLDPSSVPAAPSSFVSVTATSFPSADADLLLSFDSPKRADPLEVETTTQESDEAAPPATADSAFDPFAGNDIRGMATDLSNAANEPATEDPFAMLS
ncbi:hypothetical protein Poli38472_003124 [Pythium oligandrum]|uniref:Beach-domain-containing protein n=1 Tax=Pythium oligandrum TaxID=41045 RepID=A0A8K1C677_PYTOL|nr:hypothetical protein Poli38472_003124 [Pythium oligandrum]|eukprot:TMW57199.1 hypothetical protein Poli38472_003124 [Pythium oligandrum]